MSRLLAPKKGWLAHYSGLIGTWAKGNSLSCEAEDAVQESVIQFLGKGPAAVLNPKAYLLRSSRNHLINEVKRRSRTEMISLEELARDDHPLLSDPEACLRAGELAQALEAALAQLPLKKRQAFIASRASDSESAILRNTRRRAFCWPHTAPRATCSRMRHAPWPRSPEKCCPRHAINEGGRENCVQNPAISTCFAGDFRHDESITEFAGKVAEKICL